MDMECGLGTPQSMSVGNPFHMESSDRVSGESDHDLNPFADSPTQSPVLQEISPKSKRSPSISAKSDIVKVPEPENMIQWRKDKEKLLEEQDAAENRRKEEMADLARSQYETWFENYNSVVEKTRKANRESNDQFMKVDSIERKKIGFIDSGATILMKKESEEELSVWECVAKLCDLSPNNRSIKSDVNRMRQLMLQLKAQKFPRPSNKPST